MTLLGATVSYCGLSNVTIVGVTSTKNSCKLRKSSIFSFYRIAQLIHQCLYKSHYLVQKAYCTPAAEEVDQRARSTSTRSHEDSFYSVLCFKCGILCHEPVFSGRCPAVRCLFKQRLLQKQPKHQILQQKMLYDALTRRLLGRETVHNKGCTSDMVFISKETATKTQAD